MMADTSDPSILEEEAEGQPHLHTELHDSQSHRLSKQNKTRPDYGAGVQKVCNTDG